MEREAKGVVAPVKTDPQRGAREIESVDLAQLEDFWGRQAEEFVDWTEPWSEVLSGEFASGNCSWFTGARLNASYNCLDRHLEEGNGKRTALIWQGEDENEVERYSYVQLHQHVCRFANVLKKKGVRKGDCVTIYLSMVPELVIAVLACARIGAAHNVVFSGFSPVNLQTRLEECKSKVLITASSINRAGRNLPLKTNGDEAIADCSHVKSCIVVKRSDRAITMKPGRDSWYHEEMEANDISDSCEIEEMDASDTLFILYTSGSTGKPKGVVHSTGGYLLYTLFTTRKVFGVQEDDVFWCTADIGWITGHSYSVYGPLGLGATTLIYEGIPLYPGPGRYWQIVEKFKVNIFYTAPTVIRALMRFGSEPVAKHDISSLKVLGSVGEPINTEAWQWYNTEIGRGDLPIVDTWWATETGGVVVSPLHDAKLFKPGSAATPLPGIEVRVVDEAGEELGVNEVGRLVITSPWPGMLKEIYGEENSITNNYFRFSSTGFDTGDGARIDEDGYIWITGRLDDVINVSGHRIGTAEIESALLTHAKVAEAAVVGKPDVVKGQVLYGYVMLSFGVEESPELLRELKEHVRSEIGPIASLATIQYTSGLPKTRSGKIMRRLLKKIASDDFDNFGDVSSLADPSVIADLVEGKKGAAIDI